MGFHRISSFCSSDFIGFHRFVHGISLNCANCAYCASCTEDPELIARQALDGTNRYRASKAGNIHPFQQIEVTGRPLKVLNHLEPLNPNLIWGFKNVDPTDAHH